MAEVAPMEIRETGSPLLPKPVEQFRNYEDANPRVEEFYRLNHTYQTLDFVLGKKRDYLELNRRVMTVWETLDFLNTLVDDSDPDIDFTQIEHALQTAESIRAANQPRWFIATGLVHDLGKILCLFGEPQWAVVGDTFPVGCRWSPKIVHSQFFAHNPDRNVPEYQTEDGIYEPGCGLDNVRPHRRAARSPRPGRRPAKGSGSATPASCPWSARCAPRGGSA
jgi:inositol oxygenase